MLGTCAGFIWFQESHLNIAPRGHPAEEEVQVTLIVVITVIVAIAGQTTEDDIQPVQSDRLGIVHVLRCHKTACGKLLENCS